MQDNLNTHKPASLYEAFPAAEARRLVERFEWHYTPKHGSWLDMAEFELGVVSSQCLDRRIPDKQTLIEEVAAWEDDRNKNHTKADWQFTTADARIKLKRLYPTVYGTTSGHEVWRGWDKGTRLVEQRCHLFIPQLGEVAIELADGEEILRGVQAHGLVHLAPQLRECVVRRDRHGEHQPSRLAPSCGTQGGKHGGTSGDAVIDNDGRASGDLDGGVDRRNRRDGGVRSPVAPPPSPLPGTPTRHPRRATRRGSVTSSGMLAVGDRSDREFLLERRADLAHQDEIERCRQSAGNLESHRHATARQCQNDRLLSLNDSSRTASRLPASCRSVNCMSCLRRFGREMLQEPSTRQGDH